MPQPKLLIKILMCGKISIISGGDRYIMSGLAQTIIYLLAAIAFLALSYFLMMRSVNKRLESIKAKNKKRK
jgi:intracellular septation protein A